MAKNSNIWTGKQGKLTEAGRERQTDLVEESCASSGSTAAPPAGWHQVWEALGHDHGY